MFPTCQKHIIYHQLERKKQKKVIQLNSHRLPSIELTSSTSAHSSASVSKSQTRPSNRSAKGAKNIYDTQMTTLRSYKRQQHTSPLGTPGDRMSSNSIRRATHLAFVLRKFPRFCFCRRSMRVEFVFFG